MLFCWAKRFVAFRLHIIIIMGTMKGVAYMLSDRIKTLRAAKGISQETLARELHVVRQTVSKWEKGLSVPDADMLLALARALDSSPEALLRGTAESEAEQSAPSADLAKELETLNRKLAVQVEKNRRVWRGLSAAALVLAVFGLLIQLLPRLYNWFINIRLQALTGIIGGADGPTAIFLSRSGPNYLVLGLLTALFALGVFGLIKNRRYK